MADWDVPDTGNVTTNGTNFASAIASAARGDTITLHNGIEYRSAGFTLGDKGAGSTYIEIRSSALASLPVDTRVSPASISNMPLVTTSSGSPVFTFSADSHHWKLSGLAVTTATSFPNSQRTPALISKADGITYGHWPDNLVFDRCLIYASDTDPIYRSAEEGFILDGSNITIKNCYEHNFMGWEYPSTEYTITGATNANPVNVTLSTAIGAPDNSSHKFLVYLTGGTGNWTALNGLKVAHWEDSTHLTLQNYNSSTWALTNIDSTSFGTFTGQSINKLTGHAATSRAICAITGPGPYTIHNNFLEAYYTPIFTGGGGSWIDPQNVVTVNTVNSLTQVVLSSVGQLQVGDLISFSAMQDQSISGATAGSPTIITVQAHGYPAGTYLYPEGHITISGFTGAWTGLNGSWGGGGNGGATGTVTVVDSTHLSVSFNSTGLGSATFSSPKWVAMTKPNGANPDQWAVGKVTNISGNTVTYQWWGQQPQNTNGNGAGILVAVGATAQFRGRVIDGIDVQNNTFSCKRDWIWLIRDIAKAEVNGSGQPPKAAWEAKMADNVTINGNIFQIEGGDLDPAYGTVCLGINQANQDGSTPWVTVNHWVVTNNLFKNYTYQKVSLREEYETGAVSTDFLFHNNLLTPSDAAFFNWEGSDNIRVTHNTVRNNGGSGPGGSSTFANVFVINTNSVVKDNIGNWCTYGVVRQDGASWTPTSSNNYLIDNLSVGSFSETGMIRVANDAAMGFTNVTSADAGGDYHGYQLTSGSVGHNAASDGTDVGVNFAALDAALAGGSGGGDPDPTPSNPRVKLIAISM